MKRRILGSITRKPRVLMMILVMSVLFSVPQSTYGMTNSSVDLPVVPKPLYVCYFNANGGMVSQTSKLVQYTNIYGSLPSPTRNKYVFKGWYTAKTGGTKVTQYSIFEGTSNITLYARWQKKTSYDKEVMKQVNIQRQKQKLKTLKWDKKLTKGTNTRAKEITENFSHIRPNGGSGAKYLLKFVKKGRSSGECLGKGFDDPVKLVDAFMNSPSHRRIIMMKKARTVAVSSYVSGGVTYWCLGVSALYK